MAYKADFLDCCGDPVLEKEAVLIKDSHDTRTILRCVNCGSYWFSRFCEHMNSETDIPDSQIQWYVALTDGEAVAALQIGKHPRLAGRACFHIDEGMVTETTYPPV